MRRITFFIALMVFCNLSQCSEEKFRSAPEQESEEANPQINSGAQEPLVEQPSNSNPGIPDPNPILPFPSNGIPPIAVDCNTTTTTVDESQSYSFPAWENISFIAGKCNAPISTVGAVAFTAAQKVCELKGYGRAENPTARGFDSPKNNYIWHWSETQKAFERRGAKTDNRKLYTVTCVGLVVDECSQASIPVNCNTP